MKKVLLSMILVLSCTKIIYSQELSQTESTSKFPDALFFKISKPLQIVGPTIISSSGGKSKFSDIVLEWTLGESFISTASNNTQLYTAGFHQPTVLRHQLLYQSDTNESSVSIYPNPVDNILNVQMQLIKQDFVTLILTDLLGRSLFEQSIDGKLTKAEVSVRDFSSGAYQLQVLDMNGKPISAFKIIKSN